ncbi:MAG: hypothetical protein JST54_29565 [Deltaproteobacteria bacterium]|nr:hypothetical protein [Deltaproteobacteria bacterium]
MRRLLILLLLASACASHRPKPVSEMDVDEFAQAVHAKIQEADAELAAKPEAALVDVRFAQALIIQPPLSVLGDISKLVPILNDVAQAYGRVAPPNVGWIGDVAQVSLDHGDAKSALDWLNLNQDVFDNGGDAAQKRFAQLVGEANKKLFPPPDPKEVKAKACVDEVMKDDLEGRYLDAIRAAKPGGPCAAGVFEASVRAAELQILVRARTSSCDAVGFTVQVLDVLNRDLKALDPGAELEARHRTEVPRCELEVRKALFKGDRDAARAGLEKLKTWKPPPASVDELEAKLEQK